MKRLAVFVLLSAAAFSSCKKEEATANVTFEVREISQATPAYTVEFTNDKSGSTMVSGSSSSSFSSGILELLQGEYVKLKVSCSDPTFELHLYIYVNGNLWKTASMSDPTASVMLDGNVPAE